MEAQNLLLKPKGNFLSVDDYFFGSVLNHNSELYGLSQSSTFDGLQKSFVEETLLPRYKEDKLSLDSGDGLSIESIRVMRMLLT